MIKKIFNIILFILLVGSEGFSQRLLKLNVELDGSEKLLSYFNKAGNTYVSAKELGLILTGNIYYNEEAAKLEIKFPDHTLKFTAKNQFVVITDKVNNSQRIYQLPLSTLFINNEVFIPLKYSLDYAAMCYGKRIIFDNKNKKIIVTKNDFALSETTSDKTESIIKTNSAKNKIIDSKYDVYDIAIDDMSNGTLIRLKSSRPINIPRHSIADNTLFVFFANTSIGKEVINNFSPKGLVKNVSRSDISSKNVQLEFKLKDGYSNSEIMKDIESNDLLITIRNKMSSETNLSADEIKSKWIFDTVVIDAGHGGKDPGAIGVTGVKEKDVNLAIALKVGSLIEKNIPSVKVVYTRKSDEFIELYRRGKIANEAGGKLFISIHCNSTLQKNISHRGFEVYLLRPGRTKAAIQIAEFENSVISFEDNPQRYQKLTDENFILVSMAHSQFMRYSEKYSDLLNETWKRQVGIPSLGIKQAGFYVLVGASMPSVLIEAGFLSNRKDESFLASSKGQREIAAAIYSSVKKYKEYYDKEINSGFEKGHE